MKSVIAFNFIFSAANALTFQPNTHTHTHNTQTHPTQRVSFNLNTRTHAYAHAHASSSALFSTIIEDEVTTRRQWATKSVISASTLALLAKPKTARAITDTTALAPASVSGVAVSLSVCDPSVSTFRNPANNRIVHILGTAHISSASADVAGQLVREIKPSAVFVELDAKRVGRAIPKPADDNMNDDVNSNNNATENNDTRDASPSTTATAAPVSVSKSKSMPISSGLSEAVQTMSQQDAAPQTTTIAPKIKSSPFSFDVKEKVLNKASQAVGNGIKGLYKKLESDGFSAGEEFVVAVREGLNVGSKIILGDQDVEVTLRRLTEALSKTDLKKLFAADAEMEQNMKQFLPNNGKSMEGSGSDMTKEEFSYFVETIKAKENVKMLMANLKSVAPEVYQAMVGERDLYMANGLDRLNQFDSIVAVMGIAHVDGVEGILQERGWQEVKYSTCN